MAAETRVEQLQMMAMCAPLLVGEGANGSQIDLSRFAMSYATTLAILGAHEFGVDLPVGAVALDGDEITGAGIASDNRLGDSTLHAEKMFVMDPILGIDTGRNITEIAVGLEPCPMCQDFMVDRGVEKVTFTLPRTELSRRGLVKHHDDDIFRRVARLGLPLEVVQLEDERISKVVSLLFDNTLRDVATGDVFVDVDSFSVDVTRFTAETLGFVDF